MKCMLNEHESYATGLGKPRLQVIGLGKPRLQTTTQPEPAQTVFDSSHFESGSGMSKKHLQKVGKQVRQVRLVGRLAGRYTGGQTGMVRVRARVQVRVRVRVGARVGARVRVRVRVMDK